MGLLEILDGQLRVGLEHVEGFVSEQFLDVVHVGTAADEFGCAAAPERMGGDGHIEVERQTVDVDQAA